MHIIDMILKIQKNRKRSNLTQGMIVMNGMRKMPEEALTSPSKKRIRVKAGNADRGKGE